MNFTVEMGDKVRDAITGFTGVVTGRCEYVSGCNQALVAPGVKEDGTFVESMWLDDDRLEVIESNVIKLPRRTAAGFDKPAPTR